MPYCYVLSEDGSPSIEKELGTSETAKLSGDSAGAAISETALSDVIANASAIVDGYCSRYYDVPFSTVPEVIKQVTLSIAIYKLYENKKAGAGDAVRRRYEDAMAILKDVNSGKLSLETTDVSAPSRLRPTVAFQANTRLFKRGFCS